MTSSQKLVGTWYNEHGSELKLSVLEGQISGTFTSAIGLHKGPHESLVTGYYAQDLLAFVADFGRFGSLTAWTGHVIEENGETLIDCQWQMTVALPSPGQAEELFRGTWVGSDVFRRSKPERRSVARVPSHPLPDWP